MPQYAVRIDVVQLYPSGRERVIERAEGDTHNAPVHAYKEFVKAREAALGPGDIA